MCSYLYLPNPNGAASSGRGLVKLLCQLSASKSAHVGASLTRNTREFTLYTSGVM